MKFDIRYDQPVWSGVRSRKVRRFLTEHLKSDWYRRATGIPDLREYEVERMVRALEYEVEELAADGMPIEPIKVEFKRRLEDEGGGALAWTVWARRKRRLVVKLVFATEPSDWGVSGMTPRTVLHEMAHVWAIAVGDKDDHGLAWMRKMKELTEIYENITGVRVW